MKDYKNISEMYALGAISFQQFIEEFAHEEVADFLRAFKYAKEYGEQYDAYCEQMCLREAEIEESWHQFEKERYNNQVALDEFEDFCNSEYLWWEEFIEEYEKNKEEYERKKYLCKIAEDAAQLYVSFDTILKFFKVYNLTPVERCRFWIDYYMFKL